MTSILRQNLELGKVIAVVLFAVSATWAVSNWKYSQDQANILINQKIDLVLANQQSEKSFRDTVNKWHQVDVSTQQGIKKDVTYLFRRLHIVRNDDEYFTERRVNGKLQVILHRTLNQ